MDNLMLLASSNAKLTLYKWQGDPIELNKKITELTSISTLQLKDDTSRENPTFIVGLNDSVLKCNYCYYKPFNRYYFCKVTVLKGNRAEIVCNTDLLMTANADIKRSTATATRSNHENKEIVDNLVLKTGRVITTSYKISTDNPIPRSNVGSYVLTVAN